MGNLAVVEQAARAYPALLPLVVVSIALTLWAGERRHWLRATATGILGLMVCFFYVASPARALPSTGGTGSLAASTRAGATAATATGGAPADLSPVGTSMNGAIHALLEPRRFSSAVRLHPRFPQDFPIPKAFRLESNSGGIYGGVLIVRFRFTGEASNAVCDLRVLGRRSGWDVEILAPHRMIFRKDGREVEAWFSFPAHSVVLDIPDAR